MSIEDEMDRGADVIQLPSSMGYRANEYQAALDQAPVRRDPEMWRNSCGHYGSFINVKARRITCRDCKTELDPYEVLDEMARAREHLIATGRHLRLDIEHRQAELERAERAEKNAKSRLRAVRNKLRAHGLNHAQIRAIERGESPARSELADEDIRF